jgi:hypothetical protein
LLQIDVETWYVSNGLAPLSHEYERYYPTPLLNTNAATREREKKKQTGYNISTYVFPPNDPAGARLID